MIYFVTCFAYTKYFLQSLVLVLVFLLDWLFYNFKSSKFNGLDSLFGKKYKSFLATLGILLHQYNILNIFLPKFLLELSFY